MSEEKMLEECRSVWEATKPDAVFADFWLGWKASRESLVIELPRHRFVVSGEDESYNHGIEECREEIKSAGLKVKP